MKGDADKKRQAKRDAFTKMFKEGDLAFSPIYGLVRIEKINKITASCHQVNEDGSSRSPISKDRIINIDKSYFNLVRL